MLIIRENAKILKMTKLLLSTINVSYIHRNLALRWLYVAAPPAIEVSIKEFSAREDEETIVQELLGSDNDYLAFGVYIYNVEIMKRIIKTIKLRKPQQKIVLGGPEITSSDTWWFSFGVSALFCGEAEIILYDYLKAQAENITSSQNEYIALSSGVDLNYLESLPSPYTIADDTKIADNQYLYVETSRGCPFSCSYCQAANTKLRFFSLAYLTQVFQQIKETGSKQIKFLDRSFNSNEEQAMAVLTRCEELKENIIIQMEIVADIISERFLEFLTKLKNPRRYRFEIGIQTFNQKSLQAIGRRQDNDLLIKRLQQLKASGFVIHGDLLAGLPYDKLSDFRQSFDQLYSLKPDELQLGILKLLRNSNLYQQYQSWNMEFENQAPYQIIKSPWLSAADIAEIQYSAFAVGKFYNNLRLVNTLNYLTEQCKLEAYDVFKRLGCRLRSLKQPSTLRDQFAAVYQEFEDPAIKAYLNLDYYSKFNHHVARLFADKPPISALKKLREHLINHGKMDGKSFDKYSTCCPGFSADEIMIFTFTPPSDKATLLVVDRKEYL